MCIEIIKYSFEIYDFDILDIDTFNVIWERVQQAGVRHVIPVKCTSIRSYNNTLTKKKKKK